MTSSSFWKLILPKFFLPSHWNIRQNEKPKLGRKNTSGMHYSVHHIALIRHHQIVWSVKKKTREELVFKTRRWTCAAYFRDGIFKLLHRREKRIYLWTVEKLLKSRLLVVLKSYGNKFIFRNTVHLRTLFTGQASYSCRSFGSCAVWRELALGPAGNEWQTVCPTGRPARASSFYSRDGRGRESSARLAPRSKHVEGTLFFPRSRRGSRVTFPSRFPSRRTTRAMLWRAFARNTHVSTESATCVRSTCFLSFNRSLCRKRACHRDAKRRLVKRKH